jgi:hypothetical protein
VANKQIDELTELVLPDGGDYLLAYDIDEAGSEKSKKIEVINVVPYIKVSDVKSTGTDGGTFTTGAWRTRTLNTEDNDDSNLCTLSTNQITLVAGIYRCSISCPVYTVSTHKSRLYNTTAVATVLVGTSEFAFNSNFAATRSTIRGEFTIAADQVLEVQHQSSITKADSGFGIAGGFDEVEVFTVAEFWRVG